MPNQHIPDNHQSADGRESLSALFDGELRGDAARFAMRRLQHDGDWREACGRWQLAGDILRGQSMAAAPAGFAERVGRALAGPESAPDVLPVPGPAHGSRKAWVGGAALAASVAVAALFVVRPTVESPLPASAPIAASTSTTVPTEDIDAPRLAGEPASEGEGSGMGDAMPAAGIALVGAVAATQSPRRAAERRRAETRPAQVGAGASAAAPIDSPVESLAGENALIADADTTAPAMDPARPFLLPEEITSRPWPRAVLPGRAGRAAITASYGAGGEPTAPSFYPFGPDTLALPRETEAAPATDQWPRH